jgi:hypothetical protein
LQLSLTSPAVAVPFERSRFREVEPVGSSPRPSPDLREGDRGRPLLRFAVGLAVLSGERFAAILATSSTAPVPVTAEPPAPPTPRHVALGLLLRALDRARGAPARLGARLSPVGRRARRLAPPAARLLGRLPGAARANARLGLWRTRAEAALARWAAEGAREETEGRAVARAALTTIRERALARLTESPDLKQVIREQSEGLAETAVSELRERSARADRLAEGAVRRLLGRRPASR